MGLLASPRFTSTPRIRRRPLSRVPTVLMLIGVCLLVCVMHLLLFRGVCLLYFMVSVRRLWRSSWTTFLSMEPPLTTVSTILINFCRDVKKQIWCSIGRSFTSWLTKGSFWAVKELNAGPKLAGEKRLMNLTSLDEWRSEAYESAKMFKEKVKKWHDKRILKHEFNIGDKVLLFRSRFRFSPGKLLSRWEGPFHIEEVYRSGAIKINNFEGTKPQVVNRQRLKHYMAGDPINVDVNLIHTTTHEEYVVAPFQTLVEA